jgi:aromatic-L-amino-acid decarboxylase
MILRHFGAARLRDLLRQHLTLAREFAGWVDDHPDFERVAPVPFSVVCFRARPHGVPLTLPELDALNERLLDAVNSSGRVFLSHTRLGGAFVIRLAVGHLRTSGEDTSQAWQLLQEHADRLASAT